MADVVEQLRTRLPELRVLTDNSDTEAFRFDETAFLRAGQPLAVVFPTSTAEVQEIVRLASAEGVPIVARGAGTGLSGGAVAVDGAITVVFTRMNAVLGSMPPT
jgi:glycolate oxidase